MEGETGVVLMGGAMLSKSLIQFSVDGQGCVPSLLSDLRPWTAAYQAPPSIGFSRQKYWSGVPLPSLLRK